MHTTKMPADGRVHRPDPHAFEISRLVRYEDLVLEPEQTLGRICALLELEAGPAEQREAEAATFQRHGTSGSPQESIGRWRNELTEEERELCETAFGDFLKILGYTQA